MDETKSGKSKGLILVVDDDFRLNELVVKRFEETGYAALSAVNSAETWKILKERIPDLIIIYVKETGVESLRLVGKIRDSAALKNTPI